MHALADLACREAWRGLGTWVALRRNRRLPAPPCLRAAASLPLLPHPPTHPRPTRQVRAYEGLTVLEGTAANVKEAWRRWAGSAARAVAWRRRPAVLESGGARPSRLQRLAPLRGCSYP
jgi:hypothetical protein